MSATHDASEAALVDESSSVYDRGLDGVIALGVVSFTVALCALVELVALDATGAALTRFFGAFAAVVVGAVGALALASWTNVAPVRSRRVRGIGVAVAVAALALTAIAAATGLPLAVILGAILLVEAAGVLVAGVASRTGVVTTTPDSSAGLLAGLVFGVFGLLVGAAVGGSLVGFDTPLWLVVALLAAVGLLVLTVAPREDLGSTLPPALLVGALGATIATAMIGVGWQWDPQAVSGGFTGGAVVPIFVVFGAIVSAWAAAKCRAGFGAQGREFGAFLVINLNAFLMIVVMVAVVVFVTLKGVGYALHGFTISALAALVVLLPAMVLAVGVARTPAGTEAWHDGARALVRVLPLAAVGAVVALLCSVLLTRTPLAYAYTYTVQVNRESRVLDTAVTVTPEFSVGSLLLALVALVLFAAFYRRYGSLRGVGSASATVERARAAVPTTIAALAFVAALFVLAGPTLAGVPFVGTLGVALGALAALALLLGALVGLLTGRGERTLAAHAQERAPLLSLGVFGGLGVLTAALALEWAAGIAPSFGAVDVLPAVAFVAALASAGVAVVTALARRRADGIGPLQRAVLADETTLGVAGTAGFVALAGFHVWTVDASFGVLGATVAAGGTLSWPMTMQAYIPLGAEPGGIMPAVVGTVWLVIGSTLFAVPLGVGAAVFLTEYAEQGRFTALVEVATNALWSTPSVVFGLFGAAFLIPRLGGDTSLLAGQLVLGFMLLPLVLITSREAIKAVPDEYRDASAALGATRWQTIRSVVLPAAMPGVITGGILGVGRVAGETAPLILVLGSTLNATESVNVLGGFRFVTRPPFIVNDQLVSASASLPTQVWAVIAAGVSGSPSMGWATAFVLLAVVLTFYAVGISARTYFRRKISHD